MDITNNFKNVMLYGLDSTIIASGYSMRTEAECLNREPDESDLERAIRLGTKPLGSAEDNYLNGIIVQFDLTCSMKMWIELQRYHFIDFITSQSTIHKIENFDINKCCNEYVTESAKENLIKLQKEYLANPTDKNKLKLLYNIPSGFTYTARMTTNFRQLKTIYHQRKDHTLPEWREFCTALLKIPYFEMLVLGRYEADSLSKTDVICMRGRK